MFPEPGEARCSARPAQAQYSSGAVIRRPARMAVSPRSMAWTAENRLRRSRERCALEHGAWICSRAKRLKERPSGCENIRGLRLMEGSGRGLFSGVHSFRNRENNSGFSVNSAGKGNFFPVRSSDIPVRGAGVNLQLRGSAQRAGLRGRKSVLPVPQEPPAGFRSGSEVHGTP